MVDLLTRLLGLLGDLPGQAPSPLASLERSIAAAHQAHSAARRALGIAMAEEAREAERRAMLASKVGDLEQRAMEVMRGGREDLAMQAADAIAVMTTDIEASRQASERFAAEVALARREVDAQRRRLSDLDRGRRLASSVSSSGTHSVSTLKFENAGWAASAAGGANTTSAYDVSSISRVRLERFDSDTRRTSASSSGDTATSSVVVNVPSRRTISARSSEKAIS